MASQHNPASHSSCRRPISDATSHQTAIKTHDAPCVNCCKFSFCNRTSIPKVSRINVIANPQLNARYRSVIRTLVYFRAHFGNESPSRRCVFPSHESMPWVSESTRDPHSCERKQSHQRFSPSRHPPRKRLRARLLWNRSPSDYPSRVGATRGYGSRHRNASWTPTALTLAKVDPQLDA